MSAKPLKTIFLLFIFIGLLSGCSSMYPLSTRMSMKNGAGKPHEAEELFVKEKKTYQKGDQTELNTLCNIFLLTWEYEKVDKCLEAYQKKASTPFYKQLYHYLKARSYNDRGMYQEALREIEEAYKTGDLEFALTIWELEAMVLLSLEPPKNEKVEKLVKKMEDFRMRLFWGLVKVGEDSLSKMRQDAITQVRLRQNKLKEARAKILEELPGKHISEYLFTKALSIGEAVTAPTELFNAANKAVDKASKSAAEKKLKEDNYYYVWDVLRLSYVSHLTLKEKNFNLSIQGFQNILSDEKIVRLKYFYVRALFYISQALNEKKDELNFKKHWKVFVEEIRKAKQPGIIKVFADEIRRDFPVIKYANAKSFCDKWNREFKEEKVSCN